MEALIENFKRMSEQPLVKQLILLFGLSASIAIGIGITLWAQTKPYSVLFSEMEGREAAMVMEALEKRNIDFKIDEFSGLISVPSEDRHEIRLSLASEGLPANGDKGFQVLYEDQQFGTSAFLETARFNRALEEELQLSIATLDSVKSARVHLAIPKRSSFIRARQKVNASVLVNLKPGRTLDEDQLAGVVYMVSSSVPDLAPESVTVVDQKGRLLSDRKSSSDGLMGGEQLRLVSQIEEKYRTSILDILSPLLGEDAIQAKVTAELNLVSVEETSENYNPDTVSLRSEQTVSESGGGSTAGGPVEILSDNPNAPADPSVTQEAPESKTLRTTRNYEVDHRISHVREAAGSVKRLSVAVVVDHRKALADDGSIERTPLSDAEMVELQLLVEQAVGFDAARGDSVTVKNSPFLAESAFEEVPDTPLWQQPWVMEYAKILLGFVAILVLILAVVRPLLKGFTSRPVENGLEGELLALDDELAVDQVSIGPNGMAALQAASYDQKLLQVKELVKEDPTKAAKIIKEWVTVDA